MELTNTAEGGTSGITVTTANSGGASGDAWDAVVIAGASTLTYSDVQSVHGDLAYAVNGGGSGGATIQWTTSLGASPTELYGRLYLYLPGNPASNLILIQCSGNAGNAWRIVVTTAGLVSLRNASNAEVAASTTAVSTGQWVRLEWHVVITSGTTGDLTARLFNSTEALISTETVTASGITMQSEFTTLRHGDFGGATTAAFYLDSITVNDVAFAGPVAPTGDVIHGLDAPVTVSADDDTQQLNLTDESYVAGTPEVGTRFIAPPSGEVVISIGGGLRDNGGSSDDRVFLSPQVRDHRDDEQLAPSVTFRGRGSIDVSTEFMYGSRSSLVTGLNAGSLYFARVMHVVEPSGASAAGTADINSREVVVEAMP